MNGQAPTIGLMTWTMLISGTLLNAIALLMLKAATVRLGTLWPVENDLWHNIFRIAFQPFILGGLMCYGLSMVLWIVVLSRVPIGVAHPLFSIGYVFNAIAGYFFFHEILNTTQMMGIAVIIVGVFLITRY